MRIDALCSLLAAELRTPVDGIHPTTRLVEDLGVDSLGMQHLLLEIDDACGVMPDAYQLRQVRTVADLHALVGRLLASR